MIIHPSFGLGNLPCLPMMLEMTLSAVPSQDVIVINGQIAAKGMRIELSRDDAFDLWAELSAEICRLEDITLDQLGERFRRAALPETAG